jgi:hypothetical protein
VEPGEVERMLSRFPQIREAAVLPAGEGQDRQLVAFVVADDAVDLRQLRATAARELPDYLVPSTFIVLTEIPANDNGKRDWGRLAARFAEHRRRRDGHVEPTTDDERYLVSLWEELLTVEQVGVTDDFFALGGHSLLAFRAQRRIKQDLRVTVDFAELLDHPRLGDLAALVTKLREGEQR